MINQKSCKKINLLVIGTGYVAQYLKNDINQYFNTKILSGRNLSYKRKITNIDVVIHAIGLSREKCLTDPKKSFFLKKKITNKVIKFCLYNKIPKIIYISSIHVYKKDLLGNIDERSKCTSSHPHALSHLIAENILKKNSSSKLKVIIIRLANLFGINNSKKNISTPALNKIMQNFMLNKKVNISNKFDLRNVVPMNYFIFIISKLLLFNNKFQIINVGYKSYFFIDILKILISRIKKHFNYLPKLQISEGNYVKKSLNFKSLFLKKTNSQKFLIKEIDSSIKFLAKINKDWH